MTSEPWQEPPADVELPARMSGPVDLTGVPTVDTALRRLEALPEMPLGEHAAVYEQVHAELRRVLDGPSDSGSDTGVPASSTPMPG